jgi:DNA-binding MarR family transcriptional regulator
MSDDKARTLADNLQILFEGSECCVRDNAAVSDKLTPQEIRVIQAVGKRECCPMSAIADCIRLSLSSVTGLIDRLFEKKLVKRDRSSEDRRVVQVELTDEGRELHEAAVEVRVAYARGLLKHLTPAEQETLVGLLQKVSERAQAKA